MAYAIIRINKCKIGAVSKINKHHERLKETYQSNPDIDVEMSYLNYHIVEPVSTYRKQRIERIENVGAKRRKDSIVMQDGLITATPEWMQQLSTQEQKEYFNYCYQFIEDRYGRENIISAVVHLDEANPHMHFVFVPITRDNRLSSKDVMGGPKGMKKLQDDFYDYIVKEYPDIQRGLPKSVTQRSHVPTYLFKNAAELYKHYNEISRAIQDIGIFNSGKKKDEALSLLARYAPEMAKMSQQLKVTDDKVANLERSLETSRDTTKYYKAMTDEQKEQLYERSRKLRELNRQQKQLQAKIDLIPPELLKQLETQEKLRRINAERDER